MLIFTNRKPVGTTAFGKAFDPGQTTLNFATAAASANGNWTLSDLEADAADDLITQALVNVFCAGRPVLLHIHGNNNTPESCLARSAVLDAMYGTEVVTFSWASEGAQPDGTDLSDAHNDDPGNENELAEVDADNRTEGPIIKTARRYRQAKNNAIDSVDALARFLRLMAAARLQANAQPFSLAVHSLGNHFLQYTLEIEAAREALGAAYNVALVAACTRAAGHKDWVAKIRPRGKVFITYNDNDTVLFGAFIADSGQIKLGATPGDDRVQGGMVRYVSFTDSLVGLFGYGYFVFDGLLDKTKEMFRRVFQSRPDLNPGEAPRKVYALGCDADGVTCYVGAPLVTGDH